MAKAAILATGEEILKGWGRDTASLELSLYLEDKGFQIRHRAVAGDDPLEVEQALRWCLDHFDLTVTVGGLGCTPDDVTREAASRATGRPLINDGDLFERLSKKFVRKPGPQHYRFADVLQGALIIDNGAGVACGQLLLPNTVESGQAGEAATKVSGALFLLPGPGPERKSIIESLEKCPEWIDFSETLCGESRPQLLMARVYGTFESLVVEALADEGEQWRLYGTYLIGRRCVKVAIQYSGLTENEVFERLSKKLPRAIVTRDQEPGACLMQVLARKKGLRIATAESLSGGMAAASIVDNSGASAYFMGGVVAYDNSVKERLLGVSPETLRIYGAVSHQTAQEMASGAAERLGADLAVSCTGIAGPAGGSPEKPVGLVWFGICREGQVQSFRRHFRGDRVDVREQCCDICILLLAMAAAGTSVDFEDHPDGGLVAGALMI